MVVGFCIGNLEVEVEYKKNKKIKKEKRKGWSR